MLGVVRLWLGLAGLLVVAAYVCTLRAAEVTLAGAAGPASEARLLDPTRER
jgi:hypothetical protein